MNEFYGCPVIVRQVTDSTISIELASHDIKDRVECNFVNQEMMFAKTIVRLAEKSAKYVSVAELCEMCNVGRFAVSKITSSLLVNTESSKVNIGLNLKFDGKKLKVQGYSRLAFNGWEYSLAAVELIRAYAQKFPEVFKCIEKQRHGDFFNMTDLYPANIAKAKMDEIREFLKSMGVGELERIPVDHETLDAVR